ncbi:PQQ-dependent sugar dehydrogenase [Ideonella azotifigens]|uniref:Glucose/Sorbosone dehydrogenase domain-containing protein n=2 Tax=Ideonella azotifigens TaxID=513160 RepID=A0ABP3VPB3_9BURK|nr:PQQ-dependent sugar dehydrogenase [Ideonella azotifigens]MCD2342996.1 PQQ-dependent sugar dehydrogenase [Ideonella azotifigens]
MNQRLSWRSGARLAALAVACCASLVSAKKPAEANAGYAVSGSCAGHPAVTSLKMAPGFCVGLVASDLGAPRGVLPLPDGRVLVTDRGPWDGQRGRLLALSFGEQGEVQLKVLLSKLDRPHGLQLDAAGRVLIGESGRIGVVDLRPDGAVLKPLIEHLPTAGRHPLKAFIVAPDGALIVNLGAPTDHCESSDPAPASAPAGFLPCPVAEGDQAQAALWRYERVKGEPERWEGKVLARGLRNSMGLAYSPLDGALWQAENSRDSLPGPVHDSATRPFDELNRVAQGRHYGWPYCTEADLRDPAFGSFDCRQYTAPERLLPPHSAPLGMLFYDASQAPAAWRKSLLITLHGYRPTGHRIIGYPLSPKGQPAAKPITLVEGWDAATGLHPMGAPTDIKADSKGRLWVTEDRNGTLLVIAPVVQDPR